MQHSLGSGRHLLWGGLDEAADFWGIRYMAPVKPEPAPTPSQPLFQHLFTFALTLAFAQDMSFREDTYRTFIFDEPFCNRGPSIRQWHYLACCHSEKRPRRARCPIRTAPARPVCAVLESRTGDLHVLGMLLVEPS